MLAALPASIQRALAIPASSPTGTIRDVEHIVIFMQENRSFDHYYGTMRGVRGFGDRITAPLGGGRSIWQQRSSKTGAEVLPFHLDTSKTRAQCVASLDHGWPSGHQAWNEGKYDDWIDAKTALTMGYYKESDIPFQFALANAFTLCDAYFCSGEWAHKSPTGSIIGPVQSTHPAMRQALSSTTIFPNEGSLPGLLAPSVSKKRASPGACIKRALRTTVSAPLMATTATIRCSISFNTFTPPPTLGCGAKRCPLIRWMTWLAMSPAARCRRSAGSLPLRHIRNIRLGRPPMAQNIPPKCSMHSPATRTIWSRTVLFINYDENDGYFDHIVPPTPPPSPARGKSTVDASDEFITTRSSVRCPTASESECR